MRSAVLREGRSPQLLRRTEPMPRRRPRAKTVSMVLTSLLQALLLVGAPVALVGWFTVSSYFLVDELSVQGGQRVAKSWVEAALESTVGEHIFGLSLPDVSQPIQDHPWISTIELRKELPRRLVVTIQERQPVAVWQRDEVDLYLDARGRTIAETQDEELSHLLPRLSWGNQEPVPVGRVLSVLEELRELRPAWSTATESIGILADGDLRLKIATLEFELIVREGTLAEALPRLDRALEEIDERSMEVAVIDLRLPRRVVIRPVVTTAGQNNPTGTTSPGETEES